MHIYCLLYKAKYGKLFLCSCTVQVCSRSQTQLNCVKLYFVYIRCILLYCSVNEEHSCVLTVTASGYSECVRESVTMECSATPRANQITCL